MLFMRFCDSTIAIMAKTCMQPLVRAYLQKGNAALHLKFGLTNLRGRAAKCSMSLSWCLVVTNAQTCVCAPECAFCYSVIAVYVPCVHFLLTIDTCVHCT